MNSDARGCSTCPPGQESWESFQVGKRSYVQYDYRTPARKLFSTVAKSLDEARKKRDRWLRPVAAMRR